MIKYIAVYTLDDNIKCIMRFDAYGIDDAYKRFENMLDGYNWTLLAITVDSIIVQQFGHMQIILK